MVGVSSKGIKIFKSIYPKQEPIKTNFAQLDQLLKYLLMNPTKLTDVGKALEKKVKKAVSKGKLEYYSIITDNSIIQISLDVLNGILQSCQSFLTFFAQNALTVLRELFNMKTPHPSSPNMMMKLQALDSVFPPFFPL
jgi:hypothetical protein